AHEKPSINLIRQGAANDCYFLSCLAGFANAHPEKLRQMIERDEDGRHFTVHFVGIAPIRVESPSDGEICAWTSDGDDGLWLPVLMKAYGAHRERQKPMDGPTDPMEGMALHGYHTAPVIALFTGHGSDAHPPHKIAHDVRNRLERSFREKTIVIVGAPGHALCGLSYDRSADTIKVWNPWGTTGTFKEWGVEMDHGFFTMSVEDLISK
ncbi:unnamed protein product, partial [Phaeothamnion confervicola]